MSQDGTTIREKADSLIRQVGDSASSPNNVVYKKLVTTTSDSSPYQEHTNKIYDSGVAVIAWIKIRPEGPILSLGDRELLRLGTSENVDAIIYVSQIEESSKNLGLDQDNPESGVFVFDGDTYLPIEILPRSFVHGIPSYYKITATKTDGIV